MATLRPDGESSTPRTRLTLILILAVTGTTHLLWGWLHAGPPPGDDPRYLGYLAALTEIGRLPLLEAIPKVLVFGHPHPPGFPLLVLPLYAAVGGAYDLTCAANVLIHLVGVVTLYLIGRRFVSVHAGLLMAALYALAPIASRNTHGLGIDGSVCTLTALTLLLALECRGFRRRRPTFLLGVVVGWALFTKSVAVAFVFGPCLLAVIEGLRAAPGESRGAATMRLVKRAAFAGPGLLIPMPWILAHAGHVVQFLRETESFTVVRPEFVPTSSRFAADSLTYYLFALDELLGIGLAVAACVGVGLFLGRRRLRSRMPAYALAVAAGAYPVLTLILVKTTRFYRPAAPALIVLATFWIFAALPRGKARLALCTLLLLATAGTGLAPTLGLAPRRPVRITVTRHLNLTLVRAQDTPSRRAYPHEMILAVIDTDRQCRGRPGARVLVVPWLNELNVSILELAARGRGRPVEMISLRTAADLGRADYVVSATLPGGAWRNEPGQLRVQVARWLLGEYPPGPPPQLVEIDSGSIPNGLDYVVYRRTGRVDSEAIATLGNALQDGWPAHLRTSRPPEMPAAPCAEEDDGATWRGTVGGTSIVVWAAPPTSGAMALLDLAASRGDATGPAALVIRGDPGATFHLAVGRGRRRQPIGFGVGEVAAPRTVQTGRLGPDGSARVPLECVLPATNDRAIRIIQAMLTHKDGRSLTNWIALRVDGIKRPAR